MKQNPENKKQELKKYLNKTKLEVYLYTLKKILCFKHSRNKLLTNFEKKLYNQLVEKEHNLPKKVMLRKYDFVASLLHCAKRNIDKGYINQKITEKIIDTFARHSFIENYIDKNYKKKIKEKFKEKYGQYPSSFILFSPTQKCNLNCEGCYASSKINSPTLPFKIVEKIVDEMYNEFGNRFMTISGGEPFMYKDGGKSLFDIWEKYPDLFYLVYTNGTKITKKVAQRLAKTANVTLAISIEGYEKETDERRGKGIFKKVLESMENLREVGVPYGVSITVTKKNIDVLLDEKFYDYLFQDLGISYIWMFQLMSIGQAAVMAKLMITPKQRVELFRLWEKLLHEKKYCIADFWNSGILSDGCIAYGRHRGFFYIDWNGNIMPCAFVPFYEDNVFDLYKNGKKLGDALNSNLFKRGRNWQNKYGLEHPKKPDNWLMPCSIRDHWLNFKKNILTKESKPEDKYAKKAITSKENSKILEKFDKELEKLTKPIWEKEYLEKTK